MGIVRPHSHAPTERVTVRAAHESDRAAILGFLRDRPGPWAGWTPGANGPAGPAVARFLDPDWRDRGSLVAVWERSSPPAIVALASYLRLFDSDTAEVALVVSRPPPHRELGAVVVGELIARGADAGLRRFVATVDRLDGETIRDLCEAGFAGGHPATSGELIMQRWDSSG